MTFKDKFNNSPEIFGISLVLTGFVSACTIGFLYLKITGDTFVSKRDYSYYESQSEKIESLDADVSLKHAEIQTLRISENNLRKKIALLESERIELDRNFSQLVGADVGGAEVLKDQLSDCQKQLAEKDNIIPQLRANEYKFSGLFDNCDAALTECNQARQKECN